MKVGRSKSGLPTVVEEGGGASNTGSATVICGSDGQRLIPLFIPRGYSNGEHAIFVAEPGMCLIDASHDRRGESVTINRILAIGAKDEPDRLVLKVAYEYEDGDGNIPAGFQAAANAATEKARCYHCREPHFVA
jgi:hypothetical protein